MGRRPASTVRAEVIALAKGGDGVARVQGKSSRSTILVPRTAPGDIIEVIPGKASRGTLHALLEPSPLRVAPPCPHAESCGGCDWMHLSVDTQRSARIHIVRSELHLAGLEVPDIVAHHAREDRAYRARTRLAVHASRQRVVVGMRAARSHWIVPISSCLVLRSELDAVRADLARWLTGSLGQGEASLTFGADSLPVVHLTWSGTLSQGVFAEAEERVNKRLWAGVSLQLEGAVTPAVIGDPRGMTTGADKMPLMIPVGGFMQAFEAMNHQLVDHVNAVAGIEGAAAIELFAGSGNFTAALARRTDGLETVEQSEAAVEAARENLALRSLRARLRVGDADVAKVRGETRVAVLDPPRVGARGACERLAASRVKRVVMVSCDPATLARDASILHRDGRFVLERVDVFEMFPFTSHVETVAVFRRDR